MTHEPLSPEILKRYAPSPRQQKQPPGAGAHGAAGGAGSDSGEFDMAAYIALHHLEANEPVSYEGGQMWSLRKCPFNGDHVNGSAALFVNAAGVPGFKCHHNSCVDNHIRELFERFPPKRKPKRKSRSKAAAANGATAPAPNTDAEPESEGEPVSGPQLLADAEGFVRQYLLLPAMAYLPVAVWIIATYAALLFDCFPYIAALSPQKRCGKTRLFEVIAELAYRCWLGTAPSPAALYRMLEDAMTLLVDEVEMFSNKNKSESTQVILAVLNAGHRRGATIPRCEPPRHIVRHFPVYGPKAFAAIGRLPDTLSDRSIPVKMQRKNKAQKVARFRIARAKKESAPIRGAIRRFVRDHQPEIELNYGHLTDLDLDYLGDREADLWTPLFAVCLTCDPSRAVELQRCAVALSEAKAADDADANLPLKLMADIRTVWPKDTEGRAKEKCPTTDLIARLKGVDDSPWAGPEHPLTSKKLAWMLKPFEVEPQTVRNGETTAKGYKWEDLEPVFERYLVDQPLQSGGEE
jgi:hypothetical protein